MKQVRSRYSLLIHTGFQGVLILGNALILLLAFAFLGFRSARTFETLRELGARAGLPADHAYFRLLEQELDRQYWGLSAALLCCLFAGSFLTLVLSHRVVGPISRLRSYFWMVAKGDSGLPDLAFRKGDFFHDLPPVINRALRAMRREGGQAAESGSKDRVA
jgi:hypothetical protein